MSKYWRILGSVLLVGLLAWRLDWSQLGQAFAGFDVRLGFLALGVFILAQFISSLRWKMLATPLGFSQPWRRYVSWYFVGMFFNLVLPSSVGGDVVRAWYLGRQGTRRLKAAALTVLGERGSGLAVLVVLACVAAPLAPIPLPPWMTGIVVALGCGLFVGVCSVPLLPLATRLPYLGHKVVPLVEIVRIYVRQPGLLAASTLLSVGVQLASVGQVWLVSIGLGLDVPPSYLAVAVPLVSLLTLLPISVNGMGLREAGLVVLLAPAGVTQAKAVTLSLLQFGVVVAASLIGAVVYLAGSFPRYGSVEEGRANVDPVRRDSNQGREGQSRAAA